MRAILESEYAQLADAAARDLIQHKIPLAESVTKIASDYEMNEEQLRRLCEASNNAAFREFFAEKGKTGSEDRMVDFDIANSAEILRNGIANLKTASVTAQDEGGREHALLSEYRPLEDYRKVPQPFAKTAADVQVDALFSAESEKLEAQKALRTKTAQQKALAKAAAHLEHEKIAAVGEYIDGLSLLAGHFRKISAQPFSEFEKDAMALYGASADVLLDDLRDALKLPSVERNHKLAAHRIVDDAAPEHVLFTRTLRAAERACDITRTLSTLRG